MNITLYHKYICSEEEKLKDEVAELHSIEGGNKEDVDKILTAGHKAAGEIDKEKGVLEEEIARENEAASAGKEVEEDLRPCTQEEIRFVYYEQSAHVLPYETLTGRMVFDSRLLNLSFMS